MTGMGGKQTLNGQGSLLSVAPQARSVPGSIPSSLDSAGLILVR